MSLIKYIAIAALVLFGVVLALVGVLSVTHDTPVRSVIAEGDTDGPPSVEDPLFARSIELFTGTHIEPGNNVQIMLNGDGTYPQLWKDLAAAQKELAGTTAKLDNGAFLAKAPDEVVAKIRDRQRVAGEEVDRITARLATLA